MLLFLGHINSMQSHTIYANDLFDTGLFSDCTIHCRNKTWHLHRSVLAQRCSFFRACFANSFRESLPNAKTGNIEVSMHEDEPEALERMLKWLYNLQHPCRPDTIHSGGINHQAPGESGHGDHPNRVGDFPVISRKSSDGSVLRDEGYLSDSSTSDAGQQQGATCTPPVYSWTSELDLLTIAEKYGLDDLVTQVSDSICHTADNSLDGLNSIESDVSSAATATLFDNFASMLQELYTDSSLTPATVRKLQESIMSRSAMTIASHMNKSTGLQDLIETAPIFALDLVEALRCQVETSANKTKQDEQKCEDDQSQNRVRSPDQGRRRIYIPMNEDSDVD